MEFFKPRTKASQCSSSFVTSVPPAKRRCDDKHIGPSDIASLEKIVQHEQVAYRIPEMAQRDVFSLNGLRNMTG